MHQSLEDAILESDSADHYVGIFGRTYLPRLGAQDIAVSAVRSRACEVALRDARNAMKYFSWAAERVLRLTMSDLGPVPHAIEQEPQVVARPVAQSITEHDVSEPENGFFKYII